MCRALLCLPTSAQTHTPESLPHLHTHTHTQPYRRCRAITRLPTGTHECTEAHEHTMCNHSRSHSNTPSHLYTINSIYQVYYDSNITGGASIKTQKRHPCAALTVSPPSFFSSSFSLFLPLQKLPPSPFIPPSIRRSSPRW